MHLPFSFSRLPAILLSALSLLSITHAHTIITYPGWRGNNLITNDTFPYGMQWMYPCGGMRTSTNRTTWPLKGGAISMQPGWFQGKSSPFPFPFTPPSSSSHLARRFLSP